MAVIDHGLDVPNRAGESVSLAKLYKAQPTPQGSGRFLQGKQEYEVSNADILDRTGSCSAGGDFGRCPIKDLR